MCQICIAHKQLKCSWIGRFIPMTSKVLCGVLCSLKVREHRTLNSHRCITWHYIHKANKISPTHHFNAEFDPCFRASVCEAFWAESSFILTTILKPKWLRLWGCGWLHNDRYKRILIWWRGMEPWRRGCCQQCQCVAARLEHTKSWGHCLPEEMWKKCCIAQIVNLDKNRSYHDALDHNIVTPDVCWWPGPEI